MGVKVTIPNTGSDYLTFGSANTADAAKVGGYEDSTGNGHLELYTTANGTSTERMRIDSAGNVCVGTSTALATASNRGNVTINGSSGSIVAMGVGGSTKGYLFQDSSTMYLVNAGAGSTNFEVNGSERMRIDSSGNLLVGATGTAKGKVHIQGGITNSGVSYVYYSISGGAPLTGYVSNTSTTWSLWCSDRIGAQEFNAYSDKRLKENIRSIESTSALDFVNKVPAVIYNWKGDKADKFGFIAQDIIKAGFSNLIGQYANDSMEETVDEDGFVSPAGQQFNVNYDQIVPVLCSAIKEQQAQIETLTAKVAALEAK